MVRGSRSIPALFGEIKINAIGQMKQTEEKSHDAIGIIAGPVDEVGNADRKQTASAEDEGPAENFHAARHKEASGVKGAPIKDDPTQGQPKQSHRVPDVFRSCINVGKDHRAD